VYFGERIDKESMFAVVFGVTRVLRHSGHVPRDPAGDAQLPLSMERPTFTIREIFMPKPK
jgi:hypothetical protein